MTSIGSELQPPAPDDRQSIYDIIIVGGGPVGLTLANLLGSYDLRVLVLEQDIARPDAPRAVALDDESLRIWQQCGLVERILPFVAQGDEGDIVFTYRDRQGRPLFSLEQHGRPYGYARGNVFLYHAVLTELLTGLKRFTHIRYQPGMLVENFTQDRDRVRVFARDTAGSGHTYSCRYLIGCDGGRSRIRQRLGISLEGRNYRESWLIVDTFSPSLAGQALSEGVQVWCDNLCPTAMIPLPQGWRRWEFLLRGIDTSQTQVLAEEHIRSLIAARKSLGDARIVRKLVHTYRARIVREYSRGRVFLAGDAAHLSPPFAGQGMATGLRDAANLAWKLAHVLNRSDSPELLSSYTRERSAHQRKMLKLAVRMGRMMMPRNALQALLIRCFFSSAGQTSVLRGRMEIRGRNVTPCYAPKIAKPHSRLGHYLPQPQLGNRQWMDELLGRDYTLISFDHKPEETLSESERRFWQGKGLHHLQITPGTETDPAYRVFDEWLKGCSRRVLIVRPDRFVCVDRTL